MTYDIHPRAEIGVQPPAARPLLAQQRQWLLCHYTGVTGYDDPTKDVDYAKSVARFGAAAGKAFEYNYLIGLGGTIFEQAGWYRAAHCLNFNPDSYGILLMVGIGIAPSEAMLDSFRWLRTHLVDTGQLAATHGCVPHYRFRATGCPGATLAELPHGTWPSPTKEGSLGELRDELLEPWQPPAPPPDEEDDMKSYLYRDARFNNVFAVGDNATTVGGKLYAQMKTDGAVDVVDVHDQSLIAYMRASRLTMGQMSPVPSSAWPAGTQPFVPPADLK